jgi:flagellar biosynthetic protein FlhB
MPDDADQRTEAPTPRRREETRRKGQVAKSNDMTAAVGLLGGLVLLKLIGDNTLAGLKSLCHRMFSISSDELDVSTATNAAATAASVALEVVVPIMIVLAVIGGVVTLLQVGLMLTGHPLKPSLGKLNPLSGVKRLFGKRTAVKLFVDLFKLLLISWVAFASIRSELEAVIGLASLSHIEILSAASGIVFVLGVRLGLVLLVLALIDYAYQRWQHEQDIKMTKQEIRDEMKRMEGDPQVRDRRRRVASQLSLQRTAQQVPKADVVVTNPTEFAVALQYDPEQTSAPRVVAKGGDFMAQRIRQIAFAHGVPVIQRRMLARAIYHTVDVGREIPAEFYGAVAEILAYVYEASGRAKGMSRKAKSA